MQFVDFATFLFQEQLPPPLRREMPVPVFLTVSVTVTRVLVLTLVLVPILQTRRRGRRRRPQHAEGKLVQLADAAV